MLASSSPARDAWAALVSLAALEIVLGIDNVVFISILVSRLDPNGARTRAASACCWRSFSGSCCSSG